MNWINVAAIAISAFCAIQATLISCKNRKRLRAIDDPTRIRLANGQMRVGPRCLVEQYEREGKGHLVEGDGLDKRSKS